MSNVLKGAQESEMVQGLDTLVLSAQGTMLGAIARYGGWGDQCTVNYAAGLWEEAITQVTQLPRYMQKAQKEFFLSMSGLPDSWNAQAQTKRQEQIDLVEGDSQTTLIIDALAKFKQAWSDYASTDDDRSKGLYEQYIIQNYYPEGQKEMFDFAQGTEQYHAVHKQYHPLLREKMTERGYTDVYFLDMTGNVVYSCSKASDYGASLAVDVDAAGMYVNALADSGLAKAYHTALRDQESIAISPPSGAVWEPYEPAGDALSSFLAIAVKNVQGVVIGVFAIRLPDEARPIDAAADLLADTSKVDSLLKKLKFGDNEEQIPAPPSQVIANELFKITDDWTPLKDRLEGPVSAVSAKAIADSNDGFMTILGKVQTPYIQGAFGAAKTIQGTKIQLTQRQNTLLECMVKNAILLKLKDPHATPEMLKNDIKTFEESHDLLLHGNIVEADASASRRLSELSAATDVPASTEPVIVDALTEVQTSFQSLKESLLLVADGVNTGDSTMQTIVKSADDVAVKQQAATNYYSTITRTTTRVAIDILSPIPLTGKWAGGLTMRVSILLAEGLINEAQQILPGYRINSVIRDDTCDSQESVRIVLNEMASNDKYVALGGSGCSAVCEGTSFVAQSMRLPYLSYDCPDHRLSDTAAYPGLARLGTVTTPKLAGIRELGKLYSVDHITVISDDPSVYRTDAEALTAELSNLGYLTEYVFAYDNDWDGVKQTMDVLRLSKRRTIFVMGTESFFRKVVCGAVVVGARSGIMFLSEGSWRHEWWKQKDEVMAFHEQGCATDAKTSMVGDAFVDFKAAWDAFGATNAQRRTGLQQAYIVDNEYPLGEKDKLDFAAGDEAYHAAHKKHHPGLRVQLYAKDYYDIFMCDLTGNVIYTVYKELDYATNVQNGEWKDSGLGDAFRAALLKPDEVTLISWAPYGPSGGALASFYGTGIKDAGGQLVGVYVTQLPPSAKSAAECTSDEIAEAYEGSINFAALGQPREEDMEKPLSCFPGYTAKSFLALLDEHLADGYPKGDDNKVAAPYQNIRAQAVDGVCVLAYAIKYLMSPAAGPPQGYSIDEIRRPDAALYNKFLQYIKQSVDFTGATGRVTFTGNDRKSNLAIQQVRQGSHVTVGTIDWNSTVDLSINEGISNESWQPAHPDPPPPPNNFPYLVFQVGIPLVCILCPAIAGCLRSM
eukprot:TRINITY_DN1865_c0_g1_i2.p1 TRINITY_DN1865_c0_g1~~TRINITY_DN1865_c0_g1_i2.p1  ORF type:complete len:1228 (+),score=240.72 TRINITY_DN1865_c0_g1_i2:155-3685(+)